ncbi:MAG: DoxX family protein [Planctomycetota bacterium]|nr:DoxX family protein [Planctomycetota bacterium]
MNRPDAVPVLHRAVVSTAPGATILIRIAVGVVFASEGIQKFLYPDDLGAGRFARIGIPAPEIMGPFVGTTELICGVLILLGLLTRLAAVPLICIMAVALTSTKLPILIGHGFWGFAPPAVARHGPWSMLHEARTDLSMLLGACFLLLVGAGCHSLDTALQRKLQSSSGAATPAGSPSGAGQATREPSEEPHHDG